MYNHDSMALKICSKVSPLIAGKWLRSFAKSILVPPNMPQKSLLERKAYIISESRRLEAFHTITDTDKAITHNWQLAIVSALQSLIAKSILKYRWTKDDKELQDYKAEMFLPFEFVIEDATNISEIQSNELKPSTTPPFLYIKRMILDWLIKIGYDKKSAFIHASRFDSYFLKEFSAERPRSDISQEQQFHLQAGHRFPLEHSEYLLLKVIDDYALINRFLKEGDTSKPQLRSGAIIKTGKGNFILHERSGMCKHFALTDLESLQRYLVFDYIAMAKSQLLKPIRVQDVILDYIEEFLPLIQAKPTLTDLSVYSFLLQVYERYRHPLKFRSMHFLIAPPPGVTSPSRRPLG